MRNLTRVPIKVTKYGNEIASIGKTYTLTERRRTIIIHFMNTDKETTKLIAFDLDDTLLDAQKNLPEKNREALLRADGKGVILVPATGRFFLGMPETLLAMSCIRYAITANGALVYDRAEDRVIAQALLTPARAREIMEYLDGFDVVYDCYIGNEAFMSADMRERCREYAPAGFYRDRLYNGRKPVDDLKEYILERGEDISKVQLYARYPEERDVIMLTMPVRFPDTAVSSSVVNNVEINDRHATKGQALLSLAAALNIPVSRTASIGDGLNDVTMIAAAGCGIAMANACKEVKEVARFETKSCDREGFAYALDQILSF